MAMESVMNWKPSDPPLPNVKRVPILYFAVHSHNHDLYKLLKEKDWCGASPHELNGKSHSLCGTTPLWAALATGNLEAAKDLLTLPIVNVRTMFNPSIAASPLIVACQNGKVEAVQFVLEQLSRFAISSNETEEFLRMRLPTSDGANALFKAAQNGHFAIVEKLLDAGLSDCESLTLDDRASPLSIASYAGHLDVVKILLEREGSCSVHPESSMPPLHAACKGGHPDIVRAIVDGQHENSNVATSGGIFPVHFVCLSRRDVPGILELIQPFNVNEPCTTAKVTPLMLASKSGQVKNVMFLLKNGADVDSLSSASDGSRNALHFAIAHKHTDICRCLLEAGASPKQRRGDGITPLHIAAENDAPDVCRLLLSHGADVNEKATWKRPGGTGKPGQVTARSIANQLDNSCSPILMAASKRKPGEAPGPVPEWAKEEAARRGEPMGKKLEKDKEKINE